MKFKCPYCTVVSSAEPKRRQILDNEKQQWFSVGVVCPECQEPTIVIEVYNTASKESYLANKTNGRSPNQTIRVLPARSERPPAPSPPVPPEIAKNFDEAGVILNHSPQASAAMGRLCLEKMLDQKFEGKEGYDPDAMRLFEKIQFAHQNRELPGSIMENVDYLVKLGSWGSPQKPFERTNEILQAKKEEAEWTLDLIQSFFDVFYIIPDRDRQKREQLLKKTEAGKQPKKPEQTPAK